jgi:hypothetical protein
VETTSDWSRDNLDRFDVWWMALDSCLYSNWK